MRSRRFRSISPAVVLAALLGAAVTGAFAVASIPSRDGTITACANKKTGALRVVDADKRQKCRKNERRVTWNQRGAAGAKGDTGATGPRGADGAPGAQGTAGTGLSTSDFYTKTEAEGRFLDNTETAANALRFGDRGEDQFVLGGGRSDFGFSSFAAGVGGESQITHPDGGDIGRIEFTCSDPAVNSSIRFRALAAGTTTVWIDDGGANPTVASVGSGGVSASVNSGVADHVIFTIGRPDILVTYEAWIANNGTCVLRAQTTWSPVSN